MRESTTGLHVRHASLHNRLDGFENGCNYPRKPVVGIEDIVCDGYLLHHNCPAEQRLYNTLNDCLGMSSPARLPTIRSSRPIALPIDSIDAAFTLVIILINLAP
jgi:hypothetical protein